MCTRCVHEQYILLVEQSTWRTSLLLLSSAGRGITFHIPLLEVGEEKVGQIRRVWETAWNSNQIRLPSSKHGVSDRHYNYWTHTVYRPARSCFNSISSATSWQKLKSGMAVLYVWSIDNKHFLFWNFNPQYCILIGTSWKVVLSWPVHNFLWPLVLFKMFIVVLTDISQKNCDSQLHKNWVRPITRCYCQSYSYSMWIPF